MAKIANALKGRWLPVVLLAFFCFARPLEAASSVTLSVTRHNNGDIFTQISDSNTKCVPETCVEISRGTATTISKQDMCTCRCHPHLPAFREDLRICVDDIHECVLAPFVGGSTSQHIPFVYLPLKGQVIYPGKEISLNGIQTLCAVSEAKYMTDDGWVDIRNQIDSDVPFRLFKDEGHSFLQWSGYSEMRKKLSGRLVMVHLMCREVADSESMDFPRIQMLFSPCVAFRVVGTPIKPLVSNVSEVAFVIDQNITKETTSSEALTVTEYVAIGICSLLLGFIYVASVFLYLHLKKKKANSVDSRRNSKSVRDIEEGVIKNNPLLSMSSHFLPGDAGCSDTNSSDNETAPDILKHHEDRQKQVTSALVHTQKHYNFGSRLTAFSSLENFHQDSNTNERLPEENVSIVETLEGKEEKPDNIKSLNGATRKKLYFNPAYFEPQLLMDPPPAALEFLSKIREVISMAKQKLTAKRFTPNLLNIPEEENHYAIDTLYELNASVSRRSSIISLKRENSRRKSCTGCHSCESQDINAIAGKLPEFVALAACHNCTLNSNENKQRIRKWLEDVPVIKVPNSYTKNDVKSKQCPKRVRSPTKTPPTSPEGQGKKLLSTDIFRNPTVQSVALPCSIKGEQENFYYTVPIQEYISGLPPPDMIQEAIEIDKTQEKVATLTKEQMNAVIYEFTKHKNLLENREKVIEYETDSLERQHPKGYSTPSEYAEVSSSQPSPSLSSVLPDQEEMTMRNAIFNKKTGNMTISKINMDALQEDDHDYELIVMKKGLNVSHEGYTLAQLLQKNKEYSLVSEVYVNNGYNYGSNPSTPSNSRYSTLDMKQLKVKYEGTAEKPGKLLIEVEDCMDHYIPVNDSDEYEQDTLDRKPHKNLKSTKPSTYEDSLERPSQIMLTTTGSFRKNTQPIDLNNYPLDSGNFNRVFGSLREIYEAKSRSSFSSKIVSQEGGYTFISDDEKGRILTLEERHSKRQRSKETYVPPDVIPPPPHMVTPIYEHPHTPRRDPLSNENSSDRSKSKNDHFRSANNGYESNAATSHSPPNAGSPDFRTDEYKLCLLQKSKKNGNITNLIQTEDFILKKGCNDQFIFHSVVKTHPNLNEKLYWQNTLKPEDSGYLSSDSNESHFNKVKVTILEPTGIGSETDESLGDGHSESGAESVETHSVFFGRFNRDAAISSYGSMDSGVIGGEEGVSSSDSETISYATVIPVTSDQYSVNI
ncbi:uncharacterized protein sha [Diabrotica undecimpunctata]|uniref:uncharacterized protein sha n=1 Tax=Diabrotica undecimpunctata TaxID=50387 RepID=UPI003B639272